MKLETMIATLLLALALPATAMAQGSPEPSNDEVYPAEPVSGGDGYDVDVDPDAGTPVSVATFEQPLSSYGEWVSVGAYGNVWRPRVPAGWRPYYYGRWEWTTEGWLWMSDEPFGWATYHYGRWTFDRGHGWLWVPGFQWAPAWVSWRYGGDAVGWAPLAPGLSLYVTDFAFVDFWWTFVPTGRFCGYPVYGAAYAPGHVRHWYDATRPAPPRPAGAYGVRAAPGRPTPAWGGPAPRLIEERTGRPIRAARIVPAPSPGAFRGRPGEIGVFRPEARPRATLQTPSTGGGRGGPYPSPPGRLEEPRGRIPGPGAPPSRGVHPDSGSGWPSGRGALPAPPPGRPSFRPAPAERAPAYQPPPSRPAPAERAPAAAPPSRPAPSRGEEHGRGDKRG